MLSTGFRRSQFLEVYEIVVISVHLHTTAENNIV